MRCIFTFLTALWLLVSCTACAPVTPKNPFSYADEAFSVAVQGTYTPASDESGIPRPFAATVTAEKPLDGDPTLRDLTVTFTAPDTIAGMTVSSSLSPAPDGTIQRTVQFFYPSDYGDIRATAKGDELDGLLRFAEALLPRGDTVEESPTVPDGSFSVTRRTKDGARETVFTFMKGEALPWRVCGKDPYGRLEMLIIRNAA